MTSLHSSTFRQQENTQNSPHNAIPQELKARVQWVVWRRVWKKDKWTKIPYQSIHPSETATVDDKWTWSTFSDAFCAWQVNPKRLDGIGFVFTENDPYCGVDLDKCLNPETGEIKAWAAELLTMLGDSYIEVSPSGTGLHIICKAIAPPGGNKKPYHDGVVEIYDRGRYFTVTGGIFSDAPLPINDLQSGVNQIHAKVFPAKPKATPTPKTVKPLNSLSLSDREIIERIRQSKDSARFDALWGGDTSAYGDDHSSADLSLCSMLYFWTGGDIAQVDSLFRQSELMRDKWDRATAGTTYGAMTVEKAAKTSTGVYDPQSYCRDNNKALDDGYMSSLMKVKDIPPGMDEAPEQEQQRQEKAEPEPESKSEVKTATQDDTDELHRIDDIEKWLYPLPPVVTGLYRYIIETAPTPQPWYALAGSLAIVAAATSRYYKSSQDNFTNQFFMVTGGSGTGKEHIIQSTNRIFAESDRAEMLGGSGFASSAALIWSLVERPQQIVVSDEGGRALASMQKGNNAHQEEVESRLMEAFSASGGVMGTQSYSKNNPNYEDMPKLIYNPAITLLRFTTESAYYAALKNEFVSDGYLPRWLVINADVDIPAYNRNRKSYGVPSDITDWIRAVCPANGPGGGDKPVIQPVDFTKDGLEQFYDYADTIRNKRMRIRKETVTELDNIFNRTVEKGLRLALSLAIARDPDNPVIDDVLVWWGVNFSRHWDEIFYNKVKERVGTNETEQTYLAIVEFIKNAGREGVSKSDLTRRFQRVVTKRKNEFIGLLSTAEDAGLIEIQEGSGKGPKRKPEMYFYVGEK